MSDKEWEASVARGAQRLREMTDAEDRPRQAKRRKPAKGRALICEWCGKTFKAKRKDAKTCSGACRVSLHRLNRAMHAHDEKEATR